METEIDTTEIESYIKNIREMGKRNGIKEIKLELKIRNTRMGDKLVVAVMEEMDIVSIYSVLILTISD